VHCCVENDVCGDWFSQNMAVVNRVSGSWGTQKGKEKEWIVCGVLRGRMAAET